MELELINTVHKFGCTFHLYNNDILYLKFDKGSYIDDTQIKEFVDFGLNFMNKSKFRVITDFRNSSGVFSEEAKKFVAGDSYFNSFKICDSFLLDSYLSSMLAGIYLKFFKPLTPTKAFTNMEDAIKWSLTIKSIKKAA